MNEKIETIQEHLTLLKKINRTKILRKVIIFCALIFMVSAVSIPVFANKLQNQNTEAVQAVTNAIQTGWWQHQSGGTNLLTTYQSQGQTFFLIDGGYCSTSQLSTYQSYLQAASQYGMKVIAKLTCQDNTPSGISTADFVTTINALKGYASLYAWGLGDEPDLESDASVRTRRHDAIAQYYNLVKQNDTHPVFISHDFNSTCCGHDWITQFLDVEDIVGMHAYPYYAQNAEYAGSGNIYDKWANTAQIVANYNAAHGTNKQFSFATMQGFGNGVSPWRNPTIGELKFETFTAVVQGVKGILFWMDQWADTAGMKPMVAQVMGQMQTIGQQMNTGVTSDSRIGVSITDRNQLAYRYGSDGTTNGLLAVNIANRTGSGTTLSNVRFTLPATIHPSQVTVVSENRTISVAADNTFTDTFQPFAVHIYTFGNGTAALPPTAIPTSTRFPTTTKTPLPALTNTPVSINTNTPVPTNVPTSMPTATKAPTLIPTAAPDQITRTFQDASWFTGTNSVNADNYLSQAVPAANYGRTSTLKFGSDGSNGSVKGLVGLTRWDLSTVPVGKKVYSASIVINVTSTSGQTYQIYQVLRNWNENQATWFRASSKVNWQTPGAAGAKDRGSVSLGTLTPQSNGSYTINLNQAGVQVVQSWIDKTAPNNGFLIVGSPTTNSLSTNSNESGTKSLRPKLIMNTSR